MASELSAETAGVRDGPVRASRVPVLAVAATLAWVFVGVVANVRGVPAWAVAGSMGLASLLFARLLVIGHGAASVALWSRGASGRGGAASRFHLPLHVVPLLYLVSGFVAGESTTLNLAFWVPMSLFFWTGRGLWRQLFNRFDSKVYKIFMLGNTAVLIWVSVLNTLDLALREILGPGALARMLQGYFAVHFGVTGFTVLKLLRDCREGPEGLATT